MAVILALVAIALVALLIHEFFATNTERASPVLPLALVAPPPTPPQVAKPEPEPEPPEPLKTSEASDEVPGGPGTESGPATPGPSGPLGLDEAGGGGSDAFGLAGRPGGRELLLTGSGGGGGSGNPQRFMQFAGRLQAHFKQQIDHSPELKQACFTATVKVRVSAGGTIDIQDVKLQKSTGDRGLDARIRVAFEQLLPMQDTPPSDMPWPVTLQVISRRADCK
jgi:periplasmic protein TonB